MNYKTIKTRPGYIVSVSVPCSGEEHELGLRPDGRWVKIGHRARSRLAPHELALEALADYAESRPGGGCSRFLSWWRAQIGRLPSISSSKGSLVLFITLEMISELRRSRGYRTMGLPSTEPARLKKRALSVHFRRGIASRVGEALHSDLMPRVPEHGQVIESVGLVFNALQWLRTARELPAELITRGDSMMMINCAEMGTWRGMRLVCVTYLRCLGGQRDMRGAVPAYGRHDVAVTYALIEPSGGVYATGSSPKPFKTGWRLAKSQM